MPRDAAKDGRRPEGRSDAVNARVGRDPVDKHAKKAAKNVAKHAKKAAKHAGEGRTGLKHATGDAKGLETAYYHMQRASAVISLMEKGTGGDLRDLLERGVKLYTEVAEGEGGRKKVARAVGVLRAAEHLAFAGLYVAREKHKQKVVQPEPEWLNALIAETDRRLESIKSEPAGSKPDLYPVSVELLRQAEGNNHDAHLAYELAMAADGLCFALENGLS